MEACVQRAAIVFVDDDPALLASLKFAFETEGHEVAAFADAEAALREIRAAPACFVVDYKLPGMSGLDLLDRFRERGVSAPALLITTNPQSATQARARAAGVEILEKPLLGDALLRKVAALWASAQPARPDSLTH